MRFKMGKHPVKQKDKSQIQIPMVKNLHLYNQQREIPVFDEDPPQFSIY